MHWVTCNLIRKHSITDVCFWILQNFSEHLCKFACGCLCSFCMIIIYKIDCDKHSSFLSIYPCQIKQKKHFVLGTFLQGHADLPRVPIISTWRYKTKHYLALIFNLHCSLVTNFVHSILVCISYN